MRHGSHVHFEPGEDGDVLVDDSGQPLKIGAGRKTYTLGPAEGPGYDIEWPVGQNAEPDDAGDTPHIHLINGVAHWGGQIVLTGANDALQLGGLPYPEELLPAETVNIPILIYDDSASPSDYVPGNIWMTVDGGFNISYIDSRAFAVGDEIMLSGSYVTAQ